MRHFLSPRWLALHLLAVVGFVGCQAMAWWQLTRAEGGNALSWGYTFEWPVFGVFAVAFWIKLIRDERRKLGLAEPVEPKRLTAPVMRPARNPKRLARASTVAPGDRVEPDDDPELAAYNRYLAWQSANPHLNRSEYPG